MPAVTVEKFSALELPFIRHGFINRVPGIDVNVERAEAVRRLAPSHAEARLALGFAAMPLITAEQIHGNKIAVVDAATPAPVAAADGLVTNAPGVSLGIYVADCCAIFFADPVRKTIGLVHSGKKGTELGIAAVAIEKMRENFGTQPADLIVQLSPCIRPPHYETDFAAEIVNQCRRAGVRRIFDSGANTAADLSRYYSYRAELGKTGRMLAVLALV
jgi:copper oxidase (laccase) domain-containing protein